MNSKFHGIIQENIDKLEETGISVEYESELIRKDGTIVPIQISAHILNNGDKKQKYIYSFIKDITQQKKDELERNLFLEKIQGEKNKLAALINSIPDEVWFADINKKLTLANPSALNELSSSNKFYLKEITGDIEVCRTDGSIRPIEEAPSFRALNGENVRNMEEIVCTPVTNELRYRQVNASPVKDVHNNIIGSVSVVHDITKSKKREHRILKILESEQQLSEELQASNEELQATSEELQVSNEELRQQQDYLIDVNQALNGESC